MLLLCTYYASCYCRLNLSRSCREHGGTMSGLYGLKVEVFLCLYWKGQPRDPSRKYRFDIFMFCCPPLSLDFKPFFAIILASHFHLFWHISSKSLLLWILAWHWYHWGLLHRRGLGASQFWWYFFDSFAIFCYFLRWIALLLFWSFGRYFSQFSRQNGHITRPFWTTFSQLDGFFVIF